MSRMRVEFELTEDDVLRALPETLIREPFIQTLKNRSHGVSIKLIAVGFALVFTIYAIGILLEEEVSPLFLGATSLFFLFIGIASWQTDDKLRTQMRNNSKLALASDPAYRLILGPRAYELTPTHLLAEVPYARSELAWSAVIRTVRTADDFIIVVPGPGNYLVPRDVFDTDDEFEMFITDVEKRIVTNGGSTGRTEYEPN